MNRLRVKSGSPYQAFRDDEVISDALRQLRNLTTVFELRASSLPLVVVHCTYWSSMSRLASRNRARQANVPGFSPNAPSTKTLPADSCERPRRDQP